jgi:GH35 family endo-1,4-beta-xylanase
MVCMWRAAARARAAAARGRRAGRRQAAPLTPASMAAPVSATATAAVTFLVVTAASPLAASSAVVMAARRSSGPQQQQQQQHEYPVKSDGNYSVLRPPLGPRLRDLAAARNPPLLFGSDFVDACFQTGPCLQNGTYAAVAAAEFNAGNDDFCLVWKASQPTPANVYDFTCADRMFNFMKKNNQSYAHVNAVMQAHNVAIWSPCCCPKWLTDGYPYSPWSRTPPVPPACDGDGEIGDGLIALLPAHPGKCSASGWCSGKGHSGPAREFFVRIDNEVVASGVANESRKIAGPHGFSVTFDCAILAQGNHTTTVGCSCANSSKIQTLKGGSMCTAGPPTRAVVPCPGASYPPYKYTRQQVRDFLRRRIEAVVPRWIRSGVEVRGIFPVNEAIANQPYKGRGGWPHTWITGAEENLFSWAFGNSTHNSTEWFGQTFKWVRAAADSAGATKLRLFYNDYGIETPGAKTDAVYRWVTEQKRNGVPIDGVGFQAHLSCDCRDGCNNASVVAANMRRFIQAGFDVWVTELDVKMTKKCTEQDQASVYSALLSACLMSAPHCDSFMTWGFTDKYTWLPGTAPLMFDKHYQPKPAYFALQKLLASAPPPPPPFCFTAGCQGALEVAYNTHIPEVGCTLSGWASYGCTLDGDCGPPLTVRAKIDSNFAINATANLPSNHTVGDHGFVLKFSPTDCEKLQGGSHWVTVEALANGDTWFGLENGPVCTKDLYGPHARKNGSIIKQGAWVHSTNPSCPPVPSP